jgi:hypothetical protein
VPTDQHGFPISPQEAEMLERGDAIDLARVELARALRPICREHTDAILDSIDSLIFAIAEQVKPR